MTQGRHAQGSNHGRSVRRLAVGKRHDHLVTAVGSAKSETGPVDVQELLRESSVDIFSIFV